VILGLEDTISAEDNVRIMDRVASKNVLVYYDIGNSTNNGFDVVKEIRWLGKDRICQMHLKDNPNYMGEGKIDFDAVVKAIHDIGFTGWANLETDTHNGSTVEADMRRNLAFIRGELKRASQSCAQGAPWGHREHCRTRVSGSPIACIRIACHGSRPTMAIDPSCGQVTDRNGRDFLQIVVPAQTLGMSNARTK
jgi:hypothetical protein